MSRHVIALLASLGLSVLLSACGNGEQSEPSIRSAMVVHPQPAAALVDSYPGEVRARLEPELAFRIAGKVSKRMVDVGDRVKRDQPLAELDPQDVRLQLQASRAQVTAAEANLQTLRAERERYKTLLARNLVSHSQYDNLDNQYRSAQARLKQVRAEYDVAQNQTDYAVLRAPQDGVIAWRMLEVGQVVAAGQGVFTLAADGEREVAISLPEQNFGRFQIGQAVEVELWSQPGRRFPGRIREMAPAADPQSRTFAARVAFTEGDIPAELGQSARVFIASDGVVPLAVPLSALSAEQDQPFVWVVTPGGHKVERRAVRVGAYGDNQVPVLEGLSASDWVVAAGVHMLREGQQVRPVDRDNRNVDMAAKE